MDAKLVKPTMLKHPPPKITSIPRPLGNLTSKSKINETNKPPKTNSNVESTIKMPNRPVSAFAKRRSKSVSDLRPLRTLNVPNESNAKHNNIIKKPPLKRPAQPPVQELDPKKTKVTTANIKRKPPPYDFKSRYHLLLEKFEEQKNEMAILKKEKISLTTEVTKLADEKRELLTNIIEQKSEIEEFKKTVDHYKSKYESLNDEFKKQSQEHKDALHLVETLDRNLLHYKNELKTVENMRRQLHNTVQDLKGNIRVFCRVRKSLPEESDKTLCSIDFIDENKLEIRKSKESISNISGKLNDLKQSYTFDKVFHPDSTQSEVFEELAQLIQSALDGYDVCVFAYGQTGSGKTYTMQGEPPESNLGIIPRSINLIFERLEQMKMSGWLYKVQVGFLEIYNETLRDLLEPTSNKTLGIKYNDGKGVTVHNLKIEDVDSKQYLEDLMSYALANRSVAATDFNERSSRSHAVTKIILYGSHSDNPSVVYSGSLNLVDLAGSECIKTSVGDRITETKNINKSLSALGNVMLALHNKESHIPYRDSKLTYLLQSSLGGTSKTLMFVNISPFEDCYGESVSSLRFAAKVKEVKTVCKRNKMYR